MPNNFTARLPDDVAADAEALARVEGTTLIEPVARRRNDPVFNGRLKDIVEHDRELLERLAK
jgi:hypothetical protein